MGILWLRAEEKIPEVRKAKTETTSRPKLLARSVPLMITKIMAFSRNLASPAGNKVLNVGKERDLDADVIKLCHRFHRRSPHSFFYAPHCGPVWCLVSVTLRRLVASSTACYVPFLGRNKKVARGVACQEASSGGALHQEGIDASKREQHSLKGASNGLVGASKFNGFCPSPEQTGFSVLLALSCVAQNEEITFVPASDVVHFHPEVPASSLRIAVALKDRLPREIHIPSGETIRGQRKHVWPAAARALLKFLPADGSVKGRVCKTDKVDLLLQPRARQRGGVGASEVSGGVHR
ncbi:hypothetical protein KM043_015885 [Ampulex compressa]|nr:hypothetical protein KM043_015885 [Ampulex compressa]